MRLLLVRAWQRGDPQSAPCGSRGAANAKPSLRGPGGLQRAITSPHAQRKLHRVALKRSASLLVQLRTHRVNNCARCGEPAGPEAISCPATCAECQAIRTEIDTAAFEREGDLAGESQSEFAADPRCSLCALGDAGRDRSRTAPHQRQRLSRSATRVTRSHECRRLHAMLRARQAGRTTVRARRSSRGRSEAGAPRRCAAQRHGSFPTGDFHRRSFAPRFFGDFGAPRGQIR